MTEILITEIDDVRLQNEFKGISFSKFKKTDVKKELLNSLLYSRLEPSYYWCVELICAAHFMDIWEIFILFYSKYIHLGNPRLVIYLNRSMDVYYQIYNAGYKDNKLAMRNNWKIRKLFFEIVYILCNAKQKHSYTKIKVNKEDMNMFVLKEKCKADDISYIENIMTTEDSKELIISLNEFAYGISEQYKNTIHACYWLEWIFEFQNVCKKKKQPIHIGKRKFVLNHIEEKYQRDIVWIIWEIFFQEIKRFTLPIMPEALDSLFRIYCLDYTSCCQDKKKYLLYFAISLFCDKISWEEELISKEHREMMYSIQEKSDLIFKQLKKNELSTNTDYLFHFDKSRNLANTIMKLETLNKYTEQLYPSTD
jgi:hypothetical protein